MVPRQMRETFRPVWPRRTSSMIKFENAQAAKRAKKIFLCGVCALCVLLSLDAEELDVEQQRRIGWNRPTRAALTVAKLRRDHQGAHAADFHPGDALVPAANHLSAAQLERDRL